MELARDDWVLGLVVMSAIRVASRPAGRAQIIESEECRYGYVDSLLIRAYLGATISYRY